MTEGGGTAYPSTIRSPRTEDLGAIAVLLGELGYPTSPVAVQARLTGFAQHPDMAVFIADFKSRPVGIATAYVVPVVHADLPVAVLSALVVHEGHRRRGVGRQLVEAAEAWAQDRHAYRVTVSSGLARADAHLFYERLGYQHTSRRYSKTLA